MIDLTFYKQNGFQVLRNIFSRETIEKIHSFLEKEKDASLNLIQRSFPFSSTEDLIKKIGSLFNDEAAFNALDPNLKNVLCGHFSLETRLNPVLQEIPKTPIVQQIYRELLPDNEPKVHLPPTARFILPKNIYAAVPPHQDVSYNKHVNDFFVFWVPFCNIDEECQGVIVHKGSGFIPEQLTNLNRKFWLQGIPDQGFEKIHYNMELGDCLLLNKWVIHESGSNLSNRIRYSSDFRFFSGSSSKHYLDISSEKTIVPQ